MGNLISTIESAIVSILENGMVIVIAATLSGVIIKKWIPDPILQNRWIPTVNIILGGILGVVIPSCFPGVGTATQAIYGAICGLLASYLHDKVIRCFSDKQGGGK